MQEIYRKYRERFLEISGKNRSIYTKNIVKKYNFDLGKILENREDEFYEFLLRETSYFTVINEDICRKGLKNKYKNSSAELENAVEARLRQYIADIKYLMREAVESQRETGKYDLYLGFPFVFGKLNEDLTIKAPLLLYPINIEIERKNVLIKHLDLPVEINKNLVYAYIKEYGADEVPISDLELRDGEINSLYDIADYLTEQGIKIKYTRKKAIAPFDSTSDIKNTTLEWKNMAVIGRYPLANAIYDDYTEMERYALSTPGIDLLLCGRESKRRKKIRTEYRYSVGDSDYAQENAVERVNTDTNLVIYGPPGTGKSQTIVNIISDALCKHRRVLVVSQKQAALDVVFSRLGSLKEKALLITDPGKDKNIFFERTNAAHTLAFKEKYGDEARAYAECEAEIKKETEILRELEKALFKKTDFGLSRQEMYALSYDIGTNERDYKLYEALEKTPIIEKKYLPLYEDIKYIREKNIAELYLKRLELQRENPLAVHLRDDMDMRSLKEAYSVLQRLLNEPIPPFDFSKYPHGRYLATYYLEKYTERPELERLADMLTALEHPVLCEGLKASVLPIAWLAYPFLKMRFRKYSNAVLVDLKVALNALDDYLTPLSVLHSALDDEGYALTVGGVINGNGYFLNKLIEALESYVVIRDLNREFDDLSDGIKRILDFAYENSDKTSSEFNTVINSVLPLRIYHEILKTREDTEKTLSKTVAFDNVRGRILQLKSEQRALAKTMSKEKFSLDYCEYYKSAAESKDFMFQLRKQRGLWSIREMTVQFSELLFRLFPCWLMSPLTVSSVLPLRRGLFDLVVFDEASQMFVENALPSIYRGERIVVAGDDKQLRPSAGFVRRYTATVENLAGKEALEAEALLDLAAAKFNSVRLIYHYRSDSSELIDFSNAAFYNNKLQIAPNVTADTADPPIVRIKTNGVWRDRHNHEEALAVSTLLKSILSRRHDESVGIIAFNTEQKAHIEDILDEESEASPTFRKQLDYERTRPDGLFIKNLENVQGDERDIIIFSIGYARDEHGKISARFGTLSTEGGENRLNVAITRAKKKIYVVTSIEPEELSADGCKNSGPKLLKKYLQYVRAISDGNRDEAKKILLSLSAPPKPSGDGAYAVQIKELLEKAGYTVHSDLGNADYKLSLAIYDESLKRYLIGIECDYRAYDDDTDTTERDVYRIKFLESRGWKIVRVWSKDWWQSKSKVIADLIAAAESEREKITAAQNTAEAMI